MRIRLRFPSWYAYVETWISCTIFPITSGYCLKTNNPPIVIYIAPRTQADL